MALKSVNVSGFNDELFATEIVYLAKSFKNFLGTITEGQEARTMLNLEILGGMISLRLIILKNLKRK